MRTTLKIVLPLIISVVVVSLFYATYQVRTQKRMARTDLTRHAGDLAESLRENVEQVFDKPVPDKGLQRLVDRFGQRERRCAGRDFRTVSFFQIASSDCHARSVA